MGVNYDNIVFCEILKPEVTLYRIVKKGAKDSVTVWGRDWPNTEPSTMDGTKSYLTHLRKSYIKAYIKSGIQYALNGCLNAVMTESGFETCFVCVGLLGPGTKGAGIR